MYNFRIMLCMNKKCISYIYHLFFLDEIEEMKKYKYIESEHEGYNVGNSCILEWTRLYGESYREYWFKDKMDLCELL